MATDAAGAPAPPPPPPAAPHPLPFRLLPAGETSWDPSEAAVALNVRLDGCIVPSEASAEGARIAYSHAGVGEGVAGSIASAACLPARPINQPAACHPAALLPDRHCHLQW